MDTTPSSPAPVDNAPTEPDTPQAGPSAPAAPKRIYNRKPKISMRVDKGDRKTDEFTAYTTAFVPGLYNVKNPAGDFVQRESNVEVFRQQSLARARKDKEDALAAAAAAAATEEEGEGENGEANGDGDVVMKDKEEKEKEDKKEKGANGKDKDKDGKDKELSLTPPLSETIIIHPGSMHLRLGRASDYYPHEVPFCIGRSGKAAPRPPVRGKRSADEADMETLDANIGHLRDYLRNRLRQNKLTTDWKEGTRVNAANARAKPETIPEHNDPYRVDWTELEGRQFVIGHDALRMPEKPGFVTRWPMLQRRFNTRDWKSNQLLLDDITLILQEALRNELDLRPKDYKNYSVVLIVPDHGDRQLVTSMTNIILNIMGFREIAVHQESYCAIFAAGMSSACVVDIGAQQTSVTCVDEGMVNADTRMSLSYGGDDVTSALVALLERSSFPYRDLDLARSQDWIMMDRLKQRICTLEEHLVANTAWDFYVVSEGLTKKYMLRTYDENVLAPLCFFDTRMIDFEDKQPFTHLGSGDVTDLIKSSYDEPTGAMKQCTAHLLPSRPVDIKEETPLPASQEKDGQGQGTPRAGTPAAGMTPVPSATPVPATLVAPTANPSAAATPAPEGGDDDTPQYNIPYEASKTPLDGAIAASISLSASENKIKTAANSVLLIGGGSGIKGIRPFIAERLPPLLRAKGLPITEVTIVPPPRNLDPKFVSWKGASVMCNLESLSDMWIRRDEYEAVGARALKERCSFL